MQQESTCNLQRALSIHLLWKKRQPGFRVPVSFIWNLVSRPNLPWMTTENFGTERSSKNQNLLPLQPCSRLPSSTSLLPNSHFFNEESKVPKCSQISFTLKIIYPDPCPLTLLSSLNMWHLMVLNKPSSSSSPLGSARTVHSCFWPFLLPPNNFPLSSCAWMFQLS